MISAARSNSRSRTPGKSARTSGVSIAGLRMSPSSPPVQHTSTVRMPSAAYLATEPAPLDDSSSGWAWMVNKQRGSASDIAPTLTPGSGQLRLTAARALEAAHRLDMESMGKQIQHLDRSQPVARGTEKAGVAGQRGRVATGEDQQGRPSGGQGCRRRAPEAGPPWVGDDHVDGPVAVPRGTIGYLGGD